MIPDRLFLPLLAIVGSLMLVAAFWPPAAVAQESTCPGRDMTSLVGQLSEIPDGAILHIVTLEGGIEADTMIVYRAGDVIYIALFEEGCHSGGPVGLARATPLPTVAPKRSGATPAGVFA